MKKVMRNWHKYLGLATTVLVVLVAITGILLVHKKELGLNKMTVTLPGYAKTTPPDAQDMIVSGPGETILATKYGVFVGNAGGWRRTLSVAARKLYLDGANIYAFTPEGLQQSADGGENWRNVLPGEEVKALYLAAEKEIVATGKGIYQRMQKGEWELLAPLPGKGIDVRKVVPDGDGYLLAAREGLFRVVEGKVKAVQLPAGVKVTTRVELQKVISDLHTGAFFGKWFTFAIDLVALSLLFFSVSGFWIWYMPWKRRRTRNVSRQNDISI